MPVMDCDTNNAAHTPGPWQTRLVKSQGALVYVLIGHPQGIKQGKGVAFAGTYAQLGSRETVVGRVRDTEAIANANLIAAAPDLLAALMWIVTECGRDTGVPPSYVDALRSIDEIRMNARAAIARARGE